MATRYGYSREFNGPNGKEVFSVDSANSFDEARKTVDKGVYDRELEIEAAAKKSPVLPKPAANLSGAENKIPPGNSSPSTTA